MVSYDCGVGLGCVGKFGTLYICYICAQCFFFESKVLVWLHDYSYGI